MDKHKLRPPGTMTIALLLIYITTLLFISKMIRLFELYQAVPDTLIIWYFTAVTGECGALGWIKTTKERREARRWQLEDRAHDEAKQTDGPTKEPSYESQEGLT